MLRTLALLSLLILAGCGGESSVRPPVVTASAPQGTLVASPDGARSLCTVYDGEHWRLTVLEQDGRATPIPTGDGDDCAPRWSKDGSAITFTHLLENGETVQGVYVLPSP